MLANRCLFPLAALACLPLWSVAQTVHRCENGAGQVTFTSLSCPSGEILSVQQINSFNPGHVAPLLPEAQPLKTSGNTNRRKAPTIVGQLEDDCGNLIDASQRREAIMDRRVIAGMSQQDVESALGRPDTIKVRNSNTRYTYKKRNGRSTEVAFDGKGCVKR
ncbi:cell envelope protein SmpA [Pseudomonas sp. Z1-14]|uniref:cell envelope protein SmpA n=1 Tax=Pseudomonas sp. Z1-14 TaxID=2817409 RepID=UPI003DA8346A